MQRLLYRLWLSVWLVCQICIVTALAQTDAWQEHIDQAAREEIGYEDARTQLDQALEVAEEFGPEDPRLSQTLKALGDLEHAYQDYELARPFYERALELRQQASEPNNLDIGNSHEDIAENYFDSGLNAEAVEHFEGMLEAFEEALGEDDNDVAYAWTRIGWNQYHLEEFEEAESSFERAITLRETAGAEPENLAGFVQELGEYYVWRDESDKAQEAFSQALDLWEGALGEADPPFIEKLGELAQHHTDREQHEQAENLLARALAIQLLAHGGQSEQYAAASSKLAEHWRNRGQLETAEANYRQAIGVREQTGTSPVHLSDDLVNLGNILGDRERYKDAIEYQERALEIRSEHFESSNRHVKYVVRRLAELHFESGDHEQAISYYSDLLAREEETDPESDDVTVTLESLGSVFLAVERYEEAAESYERAVARLKEHEPASRRIADDLDELAEAYRGQGREDHATGLESEATRMRIGLSIGEISPELAESWKETFGSAGGWVLALFVLLFVVVILGIAAGMTALGAVLIRSLLRQHEPPPGAPVEPETPEPPETGPPAPFILPDESAPRPAHAGEAGAVGAVWAVPAPVGWTPPAPEPSPAAEALSAGAPPIILPTEVATTPAPEEPPASVPIRRFGFHGQGRSLFGIHIVNMLLALLTLGIYYFWGKIKALKYVYGQAEFDGDRFAFHGTGKELFFGWLRVIPFILLLYFFPQVLGLLWKSEFAQVVGAFALVGGIILIVPIAQIGAYRYRLSRTSWHGIRFSFRGRTKKYFGIYLKGLGLTMLSLGLYSPVMMVELLRYQYDNTYFGNTKLRFHARAIEIFPAFILSWVLSFVTLGLFGFWYQAELARYFWSHTTFSTSRMRCTATGGGLLWLTVSNGLLAVFTLGLAYPWVQVRTARYWLDNVYLENDLDMEVVEQDAQQVSAAAEGMADFLDLPMGF